MKPSTNLPTLESLVARKGSIEAVLVSVGEITTGGACLIGGIAAAAGAGWLGAILGERAATGAYDVATRFRWTRG